MSTNIHNTIRQVQEENRQYTVEQEEELNEILHTIRSEREESQKELAEEAYDRAMKGV